ncbi:DegT/DnrJ/EryC1/StrS family aminotransferase [Denitrobaculum tricleocarpae]|uniref:DegT/DnrJ/EryC1/StrS family aminotransferase n=1 Tax=Denitrobaculum tricleocarpae TaxID=2591009 RepID=UPI001C551CCA|nr:DegT/DnrJ/EryC1/StrS family aminotransferase [Denitrobaculum tricleocarpae]
MVKAIPFIDLAAQRDRLQPNLDRAIGRVLEHGQYILGPEVRELESRLADFSGARHAVACGNGTDAIMLALMAEGIGPGDAVFAPAFTFVATAEAPAILGARVVLVDIDEDSFNIDPASLEQAIAGLRGTDLKPRAIIAVDLFGQPANYSLLKEIADKHGLVLIADAAQSFGATRDGSPVGSLGDYTTTSFFPAKPLGCYGDGGAVFTDDDERADLLKSLRVHGEGRDRYENVRIGLNSRLDSIQAAVLLEKLTIFPDELVKRQAVADRYERGLGQVCKTPRLAQNATSSWAQYTLVVENREAVRSHCSENGVPTAVYYPITLDRQTGYEDCVVGAGGLQVSHALSERVVSLPMHPYLEPVLQDRIIDCVAAAVSAS